MENCKWKMAKWHVWVTPKKNKMLKSQEIYIYIYIYIYIFIYIYTYI